MNEFMNYDFVIDKITFACHLKPGEGTPVHNNRQNHGLAFYPEGKTVFTFDGKLKLVVGAGAIVYLPKGSNYVVKGKGIGDCYAINFDIFDDISFEPFAFSTKDTAFYLQAFNICQNAFQEKQAGYKNLLMEKLYGIICKMQKEYLIPYKPNKNGTIDTAIKYIHSNYCTGTISIEKLACECNVSTAYLRKLFASRFGVSPIQYINNLKLTRAKELLESNMYTVTEVCFLSGYSDESYFSRKFKETTGVSPSEYKEKKLFI